MSDLPLKKAGSPQDPRVADSTRGSAFRRLVSGNVENASNNARQEVERKFAPDDAVARGSSVEANSPKGPARLSGLEPVVANNKEASSLVTELGSTPIEIERENREASKASVRDVEKAAELAADLKGRISVNKDVATDAQANFTPERVLEALK